MHEGLTESHRFALRHRALEDTFFMAKGVLGFKDFAETPHRELCEFIDNRKWPRRALFAPRGSMKSSAIRAWEIQMAMRNPNIRILHVMSSADLAQKAGMDIDSMFRNNTMLHYLFPDRIPDFSSKETMGRWNVQSKTIPRERLAGGPTFHFIGTGTKVTGMHFDIIILDDFIEEEAANSEVVMSAAKQWVKNCDPLLENPFKDQMLVVGTRWSLDDWYGQMMGPSQRSKRRLFRAEGDPRYVVMKRSVIEDGKAFWPDRFPLEAVAAMKRGLESDGKGRYFYLQYMNDPVDEENCAFPRKSVRYYDWNEAGDKIILHQPDKPPIVIPYSSLSISITIDPAWSTKKKSDYTAFCVMGTHPSGYRVNLYSSKQRMEIDMMPIKLFGMLKEFGKSGKSVTAIGIEQPSGGHVMEAWMKKIRDKFGYDAPFKKLTTTSRQSLDDRIRMMIPLVRSGLYYTHAHFTEANMEMETYPNAGHPDWLSAFSYQPQIWPNTEKFEVDPDIYSGLALDDGKGDEEEEEDSSWATDRFAGYGG